MLDAGPLVHVVVPPALAAVAGSTSGSVSVAYSSSSSPHLVRRAGSAALWWTLRFLLLVSGPLLAVNTCRDAVFGALAALFGLLLRVFVLARLLVVSIGPGAEVLEPSGHHARRLRIALRVGAPATLAAIGLVVAGALFPAACVVAAATVLVELLQAVDARHRVGVDCSVLPLLRTGVAPSS